MDVPLTLRAATEADCQLIYGWANDALTRRMSFSPDPVRWEEHTAWYSAKLADPTCSYFIVGRPDGTPVGQVRFDFEDEHTAVISMAIDARWRGIGCGTAAIKLATRELTTLRPVRTVVAYIRVENEASIRAFEKAGFASPERFSTKGVGGLRITWTAGLRR